MATLHFQTAAAVHRMPLSMVSRPVSAWRLPNPFRRAVLVTPVDRTGRLKGAELNDTIDVPAPLWPVAPVSAPAILPATAPAPEVLPAAWPHMDKDTASAQAQSELDAADTHGWYDSTFELQQGLDVAEGLPVDVPADMPLGDWLQAYLA